MYWTLSNFISRTEYYVLMILSTNMTQYELYDLQEMYSESFIKINVFGLSAKQRMYVC